jgi:hypothetical protein
MNELGKLKKVPLRDIWVHEASSFTKWLSEEENLALLGDELDIDVALVEREASIGKFNVDILAEDPLSNKKIVIENQLEQTDHGHLGKLITYASGADAAYVVWVVASERDEHKRAVDWLNEHTDDEVSFFLVRIELWQIGDSPPAPKFVVVSQPNDWAKAAKHSTETSSHMSNVKLLQQEFWERMCAQGSEEGTSLKLRKPRAQHWYDISSGSARWHISLTLNSQSDRMACAVYIANDKSLYMAFESHKDEIEKNVGSPLEWMELADKKASRIRLSVPCDLSNEASWPKYFSWLLETAENFIKTFSSTQP